MGCQAPTTTFARLKFKKSESTIIHTPPNTRARAEAGSRSSPRRVLRSTTGPLTLEYAISFRYTHFDWSDEGAGAGGFVLPEAAYTSASRYHQVYSSYRAVFSPTLLNEFFVRVKAEDSATLSQLRGVSKIVVTDAFT